MGLQKRCSATLGPPPAYVRERWLAPDGDPEPAGSAAGGPKRNVVDPAWTAVEWTLARALRTARFWWVGLGYFGALFAWYAVQVHQTKYLVEVGFTASEAAWALGAVSLVGIPGQIALGHLSDRIGREIVWTIGCLGFVLTSLALLLLRDVPSLGLMYLMVVVQGLLGYGLTSVVGAIPAELFEGKHYGSIFGTLMLGAIAGGALGPWATGALHDATGSYVAAWWISIAFAAVSAFAIWRASPGKVRAVAGRMR